MFVLIYYSLIPSTMINIKKQNLDLMIKQQGLCSGIPCRKCYFFKEQNCWFNSLVSYLVKDDLSNLDEYKKRKLQFCKQFVLLETFYGDEE